MRMEFVELRDRVGIITTHRAKQVLRLVLELLQVRRDR
jgi:hypothetical protein